MTSLIEQQFLTEVRTYDGERFFTKLSEEDFENLLKNNDEFINFSLHNRKIKKSSIKDFGSASDSDFIKFHIIPHLPWQIRNRLTDMLNRAGVNGFSPSKEAILRKIKELQQEFQNS